MVNRPVQLGRLHFSQYQSLLGRANAQQPDWQNRPKLTDECAVGAFNSISELLSKRARKRESNFTLEVFADAARTAIQGLAALDALVNEAGPHLARHEEAMMEIVQTYIELSVWNVSQKPEPPGRLEAVLADLVESIDAHAKQAGIDLKLGK